MGYKINNEQYRQYLKNDITASNKGVITFPSDLYKDIMLITCGCGLGKTYFTFNHLLDRVNEKRDFLRLIEREYRHITKDEILYLTSRKVIKEQQAKNKNAVIAKKFMFMSNSWEREEYKDLIRITTAHQWGEWVKDGDIDIIPKIIVIDEIQSLFSEVIFADSLIYTIEYLKEHWNDMIKIGLTATPQYLTDYIANKDKEISFLRIDKEIGYKYHCNSIKILLNGQLSTLKREYDKTASPTNKILYYTMSASKCVEYAANDLESAFLVSQYNDKEYKNTGITLSEMMDRQEIDGIKIKDYIIENERFPQTINKLFINSACREGMNIKDENVKTVICEAVDLITIEQIMGRIRGDINEMIIICNYNNKTMLDKQINDLNIFLSNNPSSIEMAERYGEQKNNKYMPKVVYKSKDNEYKINHFGIAYLSYMNESYIQLNNRENNHILKIGERELKKTYEDYLKQLEKYAVNGKITIEVLQTATIETNHKNVISHFKQIENDWLEKPLTKEDKNKLCAVLGAVRDKGQTAKWNTIKSLLIDSGYIIEDKRTSKGRYSIIK